MIAFGALVGNEEEGRREENRGYPGDGNVQMKDRV